jgi:hypothetical protein
MFIEGDQEPLANVKIRLQQFMSLLEVASLACLNIFFHRCQYLDGIQGW